MEETGSKAVAADTFKVVRTENKCTVFHLSRIMNLVEVSCSSVVWASTKQQRRCGESQTYKSGNVRVIKNNKMYDLFMVTTVFIECHQS